MLKSGKNHRKSRGPGGVSLSKRPVFRVLEQLREHLVVPQVLGPGHATWQGDDIPLHILALRDVPIGHHLAPYISFYSSFYMALLLVLVSFPSF